MATAQEQTREPDFALLVDFARQTGSVKRLIQAVGAEQALEALGPEEFWAALSPQKREELRRLAERDKSGEASNPT